MIATLGVMGIARGLAFVVTEKSILVPRDILQPIRFSAWIFNGPVTIWMLETTVILEWVLSYTRFGRNL